MVVRLKKSVENHYFNAICKNKTINVDGANLSNDRGYSRTKVGKNDVGFRLV